MVATPDNHYILVAPMLRQWPHHGQTTIGGRKQAGYLQKATGVRSTANAARWHARRGLILTRFLMASGVCYGQ